MSKSPRELLFSIVCIVRPNEEVTSLKKLSDMLEKTGISYELICVIDSKRPNLQEVRVGIATLPNLITFEVIARDLDDFISVGLENALGDYVLEIPYLQDFENVVTTLLDITIESPLHFCYQLMPNRTSIADFILSKIASKALGVRVNTMLMVPRISRRDVTESWSERLTRNKVVRVMTQLDLISPEVIKSSKVKWIKHRRFIRISLRTIAYSSAAPLRWVTYIALFGASFNIMVTIAVLLIARTQNVVPGWTTTNLQISFFAFTILTLFGMLSEYIYQNTAATLNQRYYRVTRENVSERFKMKQTYNHEDTSEKGGS
jgi:hypothetical protein